MMPTNKFDAKSKKILFLLSPDKRSNLKILNQYLSSVKILTQKTPLDYEYGDVFFLLHVVKLGRHFYTNLNNNRIIDQSHSVARDFFRINKCEGYETIYSKQVQAFMNSEEDREPKSANKIFVFYDNRQKKCVSFIEDSHLLCFSDQEDFIEGWNSKVFSLVEEKLGAQRIAAVKLLLLTQGNVKAAVLSLSRELFADVTVVGYSTQRSYLKRIFRFSNEMALEMIKKVPLSVYVAKV